MHRPENTTNELEREIEEVHPITKPPENPLASNETNSQLVNIFFRIKMKITTMKGNYYNLGKVQDRSKPCWKLMDSSLENINKKHFFMT